MSTVSEELVKYFRREGLRQEDLAQRFGVSQAYINVLLTGKRPFGKKVAAQWAKEFGFSEGWLLTGKGPMMESDSRDNEEQWVPLIPEGASAGNLQAISRSVMEYDCERIRSPYPAAMLAIRVSGRSMEPDFPEGCVLFIRKIEEAAFLPWGYPHVIDTVNGVFVKKIYETDKRGYFEARSINPEYPPFKVPFNAVYGFYQVLGMQHSFGAR